MEEYDVATATEAKLRFGDVLSRVVYAKRPVFITKHGKNVAVLVDAEQWEGLQQGKSPELQAKPEWITDLEKIHCSMLRHQKHHEKSDTTSAVQLIRELRDSYG